VSVVCCQVEVSATVWSLVQRSPTQYVSECDREASTMRRPKHVRAVELLQKGLLNESQGRLVIRTCKRNYVENVCILHYCRNFH
jgi:hypothetical protein